MMTNHEQLEGEPFEALRGPRPEDQPECPDLISQNVDNTPQKKPSSFRGSSARAKSRAIDPKRDPWQICKYQGKQYWFYVEGETHYFVYHGWNVCGNGNTFCILSKSLLVPVAFGDVRSTAEVYELEYKPKPNEKLSDCVEAKKKGLEIKGDGQ
ncbi:hypothetical protein Ddc_16478 [Ditylenchus destructor]|nr:hypothetical protein Ddc_16478 [Ditylenchus destructor]